MNQCSGSGLPARGRYDDPGHSTGVYSVCSVCGGHVWEEHETDVVADHEEDDE